MSEEHPTTDVPISEPQQQGAFVAEQVTLIEQLRQRIAGLEARLDPPFRKPPPCSQRKMSGEVSPVCGAEGGSFES